MKNLDLSERVEYLFNYAIDDLTIWWWNRKRSPLFIPLLVTGIGIFVMFLFRDKIKDTAHEEYPKK